MARNSEDCTAFAAAVVAAIESAEESGVDRSDIIAILIRSATSISLDCVTDDDVDDDVFDAIASRAILSMQQQIAKAFEL